MTQALQKHMLALPPEWPTDLRYILRQSMRESLEMVQDQLSILDELDHVFKESREEQFR